ncbi:MarC family protein [Sulfitobacter sp. D35]|uniref:MarC family protein n=1 Tax=Sulfitobacter sp. D35 TaxID=3083252 RepID=UPI00296FE508|nr:MarC family protein [Sulfitobacter sp. D35]MDW4497630.1 MarC family protein [Sulfitobacter sp. D35]
MDYAFITTAFVTMFVVIDPIGLAPLYIAITQNMGEAQQRRIAFRACAIASVVLLAFAIFGDAVLSVAGISMPAFRVAGGILLFLTALEMLFERRTKRREDHSEAERDDPSVFPLAIPLIAGPGAIASIVLLMGQRPGAEGAAMVLGATAAVLAIVMLFFMASGRIGRLLGKTGITVLTRLFGMLLAALSVQFVLDGLSAFGFGPGPG